ncbi:MAG: cobalamin B12-binding domain-containing protein [Betaproteobacteria bacterium]|nr:MAG: cobalamin B12-binding domain-containing protein [Betaproteobacteria bacterium]
MEHSRRTRVLVAKPGLDGHDRGAKVIVQALRDAGMEVIYTGLHQTPQQIARVAMQEDIDVVGLSILSGAHEALCQVVMDELRAQGLENVAVIVGGTVPPKDVPKLKAIGVTEVFGAGSRFDDIVQSINTHVR